MSFLSVLNPSKPKPDMVGATLVVGDADTLFRADGFLRKLIGKFGRVALGVVGSERYRGNHPHLAVPASPRSVVRLMQQAAPARIVMLGSAGNRVDLAAAASCPCTWVNAENPKIADVPNILITIADPLLKDRFPAAVVTGNPLLGVDMLPDSVSDMEFCQRFRELRDRNHWISYFAATGEGEETLAYDAFMQLLRKSRGLLALAPEEPGRYESVYRDAMKYRLPTNRQLRLITSCVSEKTRVYYIEDTAALRAMYACADFVAIGGTFGGRTSSAPDIATPLLDGASVIVGIGWSRDPVVAASVHAGIARKAESLADLVSVAEELIADPALRARLGARGREWMRQQAGATDRLFALIR